MSPREAVRVRGHRSAGDVLAGLAAIVALAALVAGVPFALLTFFGSPIPERVPALDDLTRQIGPGSLVTILVALVWLAWIQLAACVLVEVYAGIRGVGVPARVPLAGATQSVVHRLVVTALLLFTATTAIMPAFAGRDLTPVRPVQTQSQDFQPVPATPQQQAGRPVEAAVAENPQAKSPTTKIYRVQPPAGRHHESLWEIAEKCLGDGRRYKEVYELNKGRVQPDGSKLTIASLIRPGWILEMPADAAGARIVPAHDLDEYFRYGHAQPEPPAPEKPAPEPPAAQTPAPEAPAEAEPPAPAVPPPAGELGGDAETGGAEVPGQQAEPAPETPLSLEWPQHLAVASLLAAGLLAALGRRRREQLWERAFGQMIVRPEGAAATAEHALREGADPAAAELLDLGLRHMSRELAAAGRTLPTVYGVHLGTGSLDLWIAPADRDAPAPWETFDDGQVWRLHASALPQLRAGDLADVLAPYPGLVSIGTNETGRILVDLEAAHGLIALRGPDRTRRAVLAAVAMELATNRWSDHMRITLVGFGAELADGLAQIAPDRIRSVAALADALPELEGRSEEVRQALAASGADSVLTGRCRGMFGEAWMPHYLIMADQPTEQEADRLIALARTGQRMAAGYLVAGEIQGATWTWDVDAAGRLRAGVLGFDVAGQLVPEDQYHAIADLFRTAARLDGAALPAPVPGDEPPADHRPVVDIRLLGPIEVVAPGPMDESRRALCTEVLVYLATHPGGVHPTVLSGAIWPRGVSAAVRDATIARVSDWLGRNSRGRPNLYYDDRGRIKLGSDVRVDWAVFRWLVWRSAAEPASEPAYLAYALDLVRGPLLADRPRGRYGWLAADELEYETTARVLDVAHRLVVLRLEDGDARGGVSAAQAGLRLMPEDEGLWRDLLRATHATGDEPTLRTLIEELRHRAAHDPMLVQMRPETEALIEELTPHGRQVVTR
jgi:hypothetical protein